MYSSSEQTAVVLSVTRQTVLSGGSVDARSRCLPRRTHSSLRETTLWRVSVAIPVRWRYDGATVALGVEVWVEGAPPRPPLSPLPPPGLISGCDLGGPGLFCTCRFRSVCGARGGEGSGLACSALPFPFGGRCVGRQGRRTR